MKLSIVLFTIFCLTTVALAGRRRGGGGRRPGGGGDGDRRPPSGGDGGGGLRPPGGDGGGGGVDPSEEGLTPEELRVQREVFRLWRSMRRNVNPLPDGSGYTATTTARDPDAVRALQDHVRLMHQLVLDGRRIRQFDPATVQFFDHVHDMTTESQNLPNGVRVTVTGHTPQAQAVACAHADGVSLFVQNGPREEDVLHPATTESTCVISLPFVTGR